MASANCIIELELECTIYCVLPAACTDNNDANSKNIIFTMKGTKLHVLLVTL